MSKIYLPNSFLFIKVRLQRVYRYEQMPTYMCHVGYAVSETLNENKRYIENSSSYCVGIAAAHWPI
jgi:hypothetical protein